MKKIASLLVVSILGGALTLGAYKVFLEEDPMIVEQHAQNDFNVIPTNYTNTSNFGMNADFTAAAENTVNGVVHVKNLAVFKQPRNLREYMFGNATGEQSKAIRGAGSGVIITPDGYIVTNNHVISGASEVDVTLNNNETYKAEVIGVDTKADIALIKIDGKNLDYIPFGDSDNVKIGEWALAVGNPFNLTSTVTAGIISAKARDLDVRDSNYQSFIQTDAAINPGNSGGALVNVNGELIGINTAITSQTGSYVGYAFAVPSNNAKKIVEDILEFGDVQNAILGIRGTNVNSAIAGELGLDVTQGFYIGGTEAGSGAEKAGLKEGDIIQMIDNVKIRKFADLTGYVSSKRPGDIVAVKLLRNGKERNINVTLTKYEVFQIKDVGLEVSNANPQDLKKFDAKNGVKISRALTNDMAYYNLVGGLLVEIDNTPVNSVSDVERIINDKSSNEPIIITLINTKGERERYNFR